MFRAILGMCGVALIALGVFGGPVLESAHQAVNNFFTPQTVVASRVEAPEQKATPVVAPSGEQQNDDSAPDLLTAAVTDNGSSTEPAIGLTEVQASAKTEPVLLKAAIKDATEESATILPKQAEVAEVVATTTGSVTDNTLFVLKERVNLREGPSINHPIVLQLDIGQELMEFKREGKWVHVGAYGTSGKIGWVHGTLVGKN